VISSVLKSFKTNFHLLSTASIGPSNYFLINNAFRSCLHPAALSQLDSTVSELSHSPQCIVHCSRGGAENAEVENAARLKLQGWKMQDWNLREGMCLKDHKSYAFSTMSSKVTARVLEYTAHCMQMSVMMCAVGLTFASFSVQIYSKPSPCYSNSAL